MLVRPEQLEAAQDHAANGDGTEQGCVRGRVLACNYYGHDAVLRVQPADSAGVPEIIVRTAGGPQLAPGARVLLRARGPVLAWPRS